MGCSRVHWWSFLGGELDAESEFEGRGNRVFLLQPDSRAVERIAFVGEIAPE